METNTDNDTTKNNNENHLQIQRCLCQHRVLEGRGVPDVVAIPLEHPMLALVDKARNESASSPQCLRGMQEPVKLRCHIIFSECCGVRVQEQLDGILKLLRQDLAAGDGRQEVDHVTQRVVSTTLCGTYAAVHLEEQCDDHVKG